MGEATKIEWCDHTWSPWRGCSKVSPGCANCYAESLSRRNPAVLGEWGPGGTWVVNADWDKPLRWDRAAARVGVRRRVFPSMCDPFEDRPDLIGPRRRFFELIAATSNLDWLLLTKRPENALAMMVEAGMYAVANPDLPCPQRNLWIGVSVEDQARADERIPRLLQIPAAVRFVSVEPLLGPIDLTPWLESAWVADADPDGPGTTCPGIDWCIVGGESGPKARPMHPDWVRSIRDQCVAAGVPFFFKQWGEWEPAGSRGSHCFNPGASIHDLVTMSRVGKKAAGRMLDGRTWDEWPTSRADFGHTPALRNGAGGRGHDAPRDTAADAGHDAGRGGHPTGGPRT